MDFYMTVLIKFILGLLCIILQINLVGKSNLAPVTPLDQVQNYVLGGIIGGIIYSESVTVFQFLMVLLMWTLVVMVLQFLKNHNHLAKALVDGRPVILIRNGQIEVENCLRRGVTADELMFRLRMNGIYELARVKRAVLEQNGQLTILEYGDKESIRYPLISDGIVNLDVLEMTSHDEEWLENQLKFKGFASASEIFLAEYISGQLRVIGYPKK
ncbi:DUF421 domain-containing protein [Ligilactobacillus apodemi]|uniref:DUF421 domain-containing protein n=1 Tax=Ligilactobacillus apodemi TaxID=307126 RepID=UPI00214AE298|nr:DUF421 domain-containing protein [Ligilactobacillus apodemi]MCR1901791.1 DUF421 domain-containing protein [Ligilactobacillus apodemi]